MDTLNFFSFQNNGIKKCTCLKTMVCFGKTMLLFLKAMFLTRLHTWFISIIKHMHLIKINTIHVLHRLSFHNTIPHRSQSFRPCYSRTLINSPLFCTSPLWNYFFLIVKNHCVFLAHIFWNCAFSPRNLCEKRKTQTKNCHTYFTSFQTFYPVLRLSFTTKKYTEI